MRSKFDQAADLARRLGYDGIAERLETEAESAAGETYRVAVTGEFKAGKSTLVNRVFLKTDLLFTDIMEATAVPTEIRYGDEPLLEIVPWAESLPEAEWADGGTFLEGAREVSGREGEPIRIPRPDAETLKKHTSAETPAGRERLARETARVRLTWPAPSLEGLVLVDTPGINTLNAAVLTTTYRILPEADLVLFVTGPKALSRAELDFLSGRVFRSGIGRVFVAVAVGPGDELSPAARDRLAAEIRGQLAGIGQDRVPVETADLRTLPEETAEISFRERLERPAPPAGNDVASVIDDLLGRRKSSVSKPIPTAAAGTADPNAAFERALIAFIRENVRPARRERLRHRLRAGVQLLRVRCETERSALGKTAAEQRAALADLRAREAELRLENERLLTGLRGDLNAIRDRFAAEAAQGLDRVRENMLSDLEAAEGLGPLQRWLRELPDRLRREVETVLDACGGRAELAVRERVEEHGLRSLDRINPWQAAVSGDLDLDPGLLARIPPAAITAVDILLFVQFGPFGRLGALVIRLVAGFLPLVKQVFPAAVAAEILRKRAGAELSQAFEAAAAELPERAETVFADVADRLAEAWNLWTESQLAAVRQSVEASLDRPPDPEREKSLAEVAEELRVLAADI